MQHIGQMHGGIVQLDGAAFNAAHIQNIVDQAEQMLPRHADFLQVILDQLGVVQMGGRQRRKAEDGVHRGTDVVRHTVQKYGFCLVGVFRRRQCAAQGVLLLLLGLLFGGGIAGGNQHRRDAAVIVGALGDQQRGKPQIVDGAPGEHQRGMLLQACRHGGRVHKFQIFRAVRLVNDGLRAPQHLLALHGADALILLLAGDILEGFDGVFLQVQQHDGVIRRTQRRDDAHTLLGFL